MSASDGGELADSGLRKLSSISILGNNNWIVLILNKPYKKGSFVYFYIFFYILLSLDFYFFSTIFQIIESDVVQ